LVGGSEKQQRRSKQPFSLCFDAPLPRVRQARVGRADNLCDYYGWLVAGLEDESGEDELSLGELLLLPRLLDPLGYSDPPVADAGLTPKYEYTL